MTPRGKRTVRVTIASLYLDGEAHEEGAVIDLPPAEAEELAAQGAVEVVK